jgi:hypothetical protein
LPGLPINNSNDWEGIEKNNNDQLVGGIHPSEKYDFASWDDDIPNLWNVIKFHGSKPPTSQ